MTASRDPRDPAAIEKERLPGTLSDRLSWLAWLGIGLVTVVSIAPFFHDPHPGKLAPAQSPPTFYLTRGSLVLGLVLFVGLAAWLDRRRDKRSLLLHLLLLLLAAGLTAYHWHTIDLGWFEVEEDHKMVRYYHRPWQLALYAAVLKHVPESHGECWIPHIYRPLPYGFTRFLELWTGSWVFACLAYRLFFTYLFVWAFYRFVRLFQRPRVAWMGLAVYAVLYPLSVQYYMGQLTDPMSHAFFACALLCVVEDQWLLLAAFVGLGVMAKETAVVLVPAYLLCWHRQGWQAYARAGTLGLVAVAAFLAVRLPFGWLHDNRAINGSHLMVWHNLGLAKDPTPSTAPFYQNYLHPFVFLVVFLPLIGKHWARTDARLKALLLTLLPLIFLSNLVYSWLYESRNYVPLLPLLITMAQGPAAPPGRAPDSPALAGASAAPRSEAIEGERKGKRREKRPSRR